MKVVLCRQAGDRVTGEGGSGGVTGEGGAVSSGTPHGGADSEREIVIEQREIDKEENETVMAFCSTGCGCFNKCSLYTVPPRALTT